MNEDLKLHIRQWLLKAEHDLIAAQTIIQYKPLITDVACFHCQVAKTLAKLMDTTVGYLLGEAKQADTFKDPAMLKRLNDITNLPDADKEHVLYTIDHLLASVKTKQSYK